jgi:RHS repeat-associated protein
MLRTATTSFYEADGLGSVTSLSSGAGALAQTYTFDSFGKLTAASGSLTNPFRYTGREFDSETGLYYYRARYYDPSAGRFISEDPVGFEEAGNFYRYVNNKPVTLIDPTGLTADCSNCGVVVKCRRVEYGHLGLLGFKHCDARVIDRNGIEHSLSAGPEGPPRNSSLTAWNCTSSDCQPGKTLPPLAPFTGRTVYKKKSASCDGVDCLIDKTEAFHAQASHPEYHAAFGPNSDTELKGGIFAACGIKLHIRWYGPPIFHVWPLP